MSTGRADKNAFAGFVTRLTTGSGDKESVCSDALAQKQAFWLSRAQKRDAAAQ
ncbi:hypothetical protein P4W15_03590 [Morganella morganii]|nr:hypothetical protein [Morganella morganii]